MSSDGVEAIFQRLREEVRTGAVRRDDGDAARPIVLLSREEAERWWAVTVDKPYLYKPGAVGRARGALLIPVKAVLRRMMRWYIEPLAIDQRHFNSAMLRVVDELTAELARLEAEVAKLRSATDGSP